MDTYATLILHLVLGGTQERRIMVGSAIAEEMQIRDEVPDVVAVPMEGFFKYDHTDDEGNHHYQPCYGIALGRRE